VPSLRCDRGRQRSRRPVSLSQPKGAEGRQPPAGANAPPCCTGSIGAEALAVNNTATSSWRQRQRELRSPPEGADARRW